MNRFSPFRQLKHPGRISAILFSLASLVSHAAFAQEGVTGLWKSIDDKTGKPKALIRITESNGELTGKIEKLFREPDLEQNPKCDKCEGATKGQPLIGLTILTGLKKTVMNTVAEKFLTRKTANSTAVNSV